MCNVHHVCDSQQKNALSILVSVRLMCICVCNMHPAQFARLRHLLLLAAFRRMNSHSNFTKTKVYYTIRAITIAQTQSAIVHTRCCLPFGACFGCGGKGVTTTNWYFKILLCCRYDGGRGVSCTHRHKNTFMHSAHEIGGKKARKSNWIEQKKIVAIVMSDNDTPCNIARAHTHIRTYTQTSASILFEF